MKKIIYFGITGVILLSLVGCQKSKEEISIVYTNDIHSFISNSVKDDAGVESDALRISKVAAIVNDMKNDGKNVLLVDAGDEVQGSTYGSIDNGQSMIDIMNAAKYDVATPGNHEFDFGMTAFNGFVEKANYPYLSCNFRYTIDNSRVLESSKIFEKGGVKIAFVGITTPETITSSTPKNFQDASGNYKYKFDGQDNYSNFYLSVQNAIDEVKNKVDYVIALGHVGVGIDEEKAKIRSIDVINNTTGLDAFIDGHSHTIVEKQMVKTKDGKEIPLTQTGAYLKGVGIMKISPLGEITTEIKTDYNKEDAEVKKKEDALIKKVNDQLGEKIAVLDNKLYVNNVNDANQRIVRARETNLGDFVSDSIYWYFNENKNIDCDVAITNGGGVRAEIDAGDVTYLNAKNVQPFGNMICLIEATGQQIIDVLEMGVTVVDEWDSQWNSPAENGGFIHVAGLTYEVDCSIPSKVVTDSEGMFSKVDGDYRVKNVKVFDRKTNAYVDLDKTKTYKLGGINYILRNSGSGCAMLKNNVGVVDFIDQDYIVLSDYMKAFAKDGNDVPRINNAGCPLKKYTNYALDYENPLGSQRIKILNLPSDITI